MAFADSGGGGSSLGSSIGSIASRAAKSAVKKTSSPSRKAASAASRTVRKIRNDNPPSRTRGSSPTKNTSGGGYKDVKKNTPENVPSKGSKTPTLNDYLGTDATYQNTLRGNKRSLADFLSELNRRRGEAGTQFTTTQQSMERDRVKQLDDLRQEFASRGLINSGLFAEEQGQFQQQFATQLQALQQQQAALIADLLAQEKNYRRESDLSLEAAKQQALQRRAAKYNIGA